MQRRKFIQGLFVGGGVAAATAVAARPIKRLNPLIPPKTTSRDLAGVIEALTTLDRHEAERTALTINQLQEVL